MSSLRVCLLGFGEVGQMLATDLRPRCQALSAWDVQFDGDDSMPSRAASTLAVRRGRDARDAVSGAHIVISAVTAAQDALAAQSVAPHLERGAWFLDLNSVSPGTKTQVSEIIAQHGARYVEAAIMSPIAPRGIGSPVLLGGPHAQAFVPVARALGFTDATFFSSQLGRAAAAKMCRSVVVKGIEGLLAESLVAARHFGVEDAVLDSLRSLIPAENWAVLAHYMISRSVLHGARRAEEMREAARTVEEAGLEGWMSAACVARQRWAAERSEASATEQLPVLLDRLLSSVRMERAS